MGRAGRSRGRGVERHRRCDSGRKGPLKGGRSSFKLVATPERSKRAEHLVVLLPPGRARVSRCSTVLSRWSSLRPEAYLQFRRPAALAACSTVGICRGFLLGRPAKNEPHRIVAAAAATSAAAAPRCRTRTGWAYSRLSGRPENSHYLISFRDPGHRAGPGGLD